MTVLSSKKYSDFEILAKNMLNYRSQSCPELFPVTFVRTACFVPSLNYFVRFPHLILRTVFAQELLLSVRFECHCLLVAYRVLLSVEARFVVQKFHCSIAKSGGAFPPLAFHSNDLV